MLTMTTYDGLTSPCFSDYSDSGSGSTHGRTLPYANVLAKTTSEGIEVSLRKRRIYVFCWIRSGYGAGASATEGDAWGACWG